MTANELFKMVSYLLTKNIIDENLAVIILYKFAENFILEVEGREEPF